MRSVLTLTFAGLFLAGCQTSNKPADPMAPFQPKPARQTKTPASQPAATRSEKTPARVTPLDELAGKVTSLNAKLRFVVLDFTLSRLPAPGQQMGIYRNGQKVGEVKVTGPARESNIAADITAGEAQLGDDVRGY